jgi:hypothetical protein
MSKSNSTNHCPYCYQQVKHKNQCKKYTKEKEDEYKKKLEEQAKQKKLDDIEKAKIAEEMEKFTAQFPSLADHFKKKLTILENRITELEYEVGPCEPYCDCNKCHPRCRNCDNDY